MNYTFWLLENHYTKGISKSKSQRVTGKLKYCVKIRKLSMPEVMSHDTVWNETDDEYVLIECDVLPLPWNDIPVLEPHRQQSLFPNDH